MNGSAATSNSYLGTEKISKLIIKLALPTVTAQIVNMLYNLVDRIYIGNIDIIGEKALTGLGVFEKIAKFAGAGTIVPITGFANSIAAPAIEFKSDDNAIIRPSQKTGNFPE